MGNNCCTCVNRKEAKTKKQNVNFSTQQLTPMDSCGAKSPRLRLDFDKYYHIEDK